LRLKKALKLKIKAIQSCQKQEEKLNRLAKKLGRKPEEIKSMIIARKQVFSADKKFILKQNTYTFDAV
jgi:mRNA-degrading endonuclease HigB of HigAB toxin-antitoxin module